MKKIMVVPDVHGRDNWKIAENKLVRWEVDELIFLGDYFDSFHIDGDTQIENFTEIVRLKKENPDKVTLLTGNHDLQYIIDMPCSGYQAGKHYRIKTLLEPLIEEDELKMVKVIKDYIFVHAGLSKTWCDRYSISMNNLEESVNSLFKEQPIHFSFQEIPSFMKKFGSSSNPYGDDIFQSPVWIRPDSLLLDKLYNYKQVVGHTHFNEPTLKEGVWFTDCHNNNPEFLILEV